jgi:predicted nucleic acid-binding protein
VRYLLDVNMLVALGHMLHVHHVRAQLWQSRLSPATDRLGTCAITELGFVRVSVQAGLQPDVARARLTLAKMKATCPVIMELWADQLGVDRLPHYVQKPAELTDGHLLELAASHHARLATLDAGVPGAWLI